ncbi:acetylornithine deacetylase [Luteimonas fraxinea]|uniref:Acetylornithine deacetylase n=1 Tax=Luteimonas fraxinea TaxID=2901869 RepID=A0ABS8UBV9_9GAMM|nr:acetylornithine deacetylase [Luteimonas fraxinea]MCD9096472.1 acetylornithine deacetylase [Luteimonas fraxinea]UHH10086.1 acetylornithine deacetylase [Luteimonas fraxinea]
MPPLDPTASANAHDWLARLVAFDTTSRNSNLALVEAVEAWLATLGVRSTRVPAPAGGKANLLFSIGPDVTGGVVLSGHTDVVPVDGQDWHSDPWTLTERNGRLHGRGAADMKGFIAAGLSRVPAMLAANLRRPVHFALSYDEEVGLLGAPSLIDALLAGVPRPAVVIVGEPTGMRVVERHKGIMGLRTTVLGHEAHSSQTHLGVSANMVATRLMAKIVAIADRLAAAPETGSGFVPPHATVTIGLVNGGTAPNILARECSFVWDIRSASPTEARAVYDEVEALVRELDAEIRARFDDCGIATEILSDVPPLTGAGNAPALDMVARLLGTSECEVASYVSEAGLFEGAGLPTVICGPGWIAQAHQPDEYIELAQLDACAVFMDRLIDELRR